MHERDHERDHERGHDADPQVFTLDDANELRRAIGEAVRAIRRSETMPEGQLETLGFLARDGALSIAALARRRRVRHQTMSTTVLDLEGRGLVRRAPDPADARGVLVSITPNGATVIERSRRERSSRILEAADRVLAPDERVVLARAAGLLERLTQGLEAADPRP